MKRKENNRNGQRRRFRLTIRIKQALFALLAVFSTALICLTISALLILAFTLKRNKTSGKIAGDMISSLLQGEDLDDYLALLKEKKDPGRQYWLAWRAARALTKEEDLLYVYVIYPQEDQIYYLLDSDPDVPYGTLNWVDYDDPSVPDLDKLQDGEPLSMEISNSQFGSLATVWTGIPDETGKFVSYVGVDITVESLFNDMVDAVQVYMSSVFLTLLAITAIIILITDRILVHPIRRLNQAAQEMVVSFQRAEQEGGQTDVFSRVEVKSHDELKDLHDGLIQMEADMNRLIKEVREQTAKQQRIDTELSIATAIQAGALPSTHPGFEGQRGYELAALMRPAKEVAGDFYDFFYIKEGLLCVLIADVSDKGVPAALFMMTAKTVLKTRALQGGTPAEILSYANEQLCETNPNSMFVTVWIGILDIATGRLTCANAGHEDPFVAEGGGAPYTELHDPHGLVLGVMPGMEYKDYVVELTPGSRVFVYTDGVPEATNTAKELFDLERIRMALDRDKSLTPREILDAMLREVDRFAGEEKQFDDITMLELLYKG